MDSARIFSVNPGQNKKKKKKERWEEEEEWRTPGLKLFLQHGGEGKKKKASRCGCGGVEKEVSPDASFFRYIAGIAEGCEEEIEGEKKRKLR